MSIEIGLVPQPVWDCRVDDKHFQRRVSTMQTRLMWISVGQPIEHTRNGTGIPRLVVMQGICRVRG